MQRYYLSKYEYDENIYDKSASNCSDSVDLWKQIKTRQYEKI